MKLLAANNLFTDTQGFTLGVDESQELVTIQLAWDLSRLDAEGFARIVNNLLAVAADWMIRLDEWRPFRSRRRKRRARGHLRRSAFHEFPESLIRRGKASCVSNPASRCSSILRTAGISN